MSDKSFSRAVDKQIVECRWPNIADRWLEYLPAIEPPGSSPDEGLSDFLGFVDVANEIGSSYDIAHKHQVQGLRQNAFREGIFLLHKAFHVSSCAQVDAKRGQKTWSLVESYQSSLFAAKSILVLCGIAFAEHNSKTVLIDLFPKELDTNKRRGKLRLQLLDDPAIQFIKFNMRLEHRHVWTTFKRVLRVFQMHDVWPQEYSSALCKIENLEFAKQRNTVHYQNEAWIYDDLHRPEVDHTFGTYRTNIVDSLRYTLRSSFSLDLSLILLKMATLLLNDLESKTNTISSEIDLFRDKHNTSSHPIYMIAFPDSQ